MSLPRARCIALAMSLTALSLAACGDSGGPSGTPQDFTGSYTLASFAQGTAAGVVPIAGATGTATLTATHYEVALTIPIGGGFPPLDVADEGTYTATGTATSGTWSQQSSLDQALQYTGTYTFDAGTGRLTLDTTAQAVRTVIVFQRT
jgi:hypothetical protein